MKILSNDKFNYLKNNAEKQIRFYSILVHWLEIKQENRSLVEYFEKHGYTRIAIYGMKELGERLYDELKGSSVQVVYCIDRNADELYCEVPAYRPDDELEKVDAVVVTAVIYYEEIRGTLKPKFDCPIINLEDIVFGV